METNMENLQMLLSKIITINTNYLDAICKKDNKILELISAIEKLELQNERLMKSLFVDTSIKAEVSE